jgi:hypothetical protein
MKLSLCIPLLLPLAVQPRRVGQSRLLQQVPPGFYDDYPYPDFRFTPWSDIDENTLTHAITLMYDEESWNLPMSNDIEFYSIFTINATLPEEQLMAIFDMGMTEDVWDCWVNHYVDFSWEDFIFYNFTDPWVALGWDETSWASFDESDWPESEFKKWDELTIEERLALKDLCYRQESIDKLPITEWVATPSPTVSPSDVPTPSPTTPSPTASPTDVPTPSPTASPTDVPTPSPTASPTDVPTPSPTASPTDVPTRSPTTPVPASSATEAPTSSPSGISSDLPSLSSSISHAPSAKEAMSPIAGAPTSSQPSNAPVEATGTKAPTSSPISESDMGFPTANPMAAATDESSSSSWTVSPLSRLVSAAAIFGLLF